VADPPGNINIHKFSSPYTKLGEVYTPNASAGVITTVEGFVYLVDELGWIMIYDYDGKFYNAMKNPTPTNLYPGGFLYGWDTFAKRLLFLGGTAVTSEGASTLRVVGYHPLPIGVVVTPPLPRQVPRKNRLISVLSHLSGEGGEPLAAKRGAVTRAEAVAVVTDKDGDYIFTADPATAGVAVYASDIASET
jgi:hypothetical protein